MPARPSECLSLDIYAIWTLVSSAHIYLNSAVALQLLPWRHFSDALLSNQAKATTATTLTRPTKFMQLTKCLFFVVAVSCCSCCCCRQTLQHFYRCKRGKRAGSAALAVAKKLAACKSMAQFLHCSPTSFLPLSLSLSSLSLLSFFLLSFCVRVLWEVFFATFYQHRNLNTNKKLFQNSQPAIRQGQPVQSCCCWSAFVRIWLM